MHLLYRRIEPHYSSLTCQTHGRPQVVCAESGTAGYQVILTSTVISMTPSFCRTSGLSLSMSCPTLIKPVDALMLKYWWSPASPSHTTKQNLYSFPHPLKSKHCCLQFMDIYINCGKLTQHRSCWASISWVFSWLMTTGPHQAIMYLRWMSNWQGWGSLGLHRQPSLARLASPATPQLCSL